MEIYIKLTVILLMFLGYTIWRLRSWRSRNIVITGYVERLGYRKKITELIALIIYILSSIISVTLFGMAVKSMLSLP